MHQSRARQMLIVLQKEHNKKQNSKPQNGSDRTKLQLIRFRNRKESSSKIKSLVNHYHHVAASFATREMT